MPYEERSGKILEEPINLRANSSKYINKKERENIKDDDRKDEKREKYEEEKKLKSLHKNYHQKEYSYHETHNENHVDPKLSLVHRNRLGNEALFKGSNEEFGFTIIGGDDDNTQDFLQVKYIVPDGIADRQGDLRQGDVIFKVNDVYVLGRTYQQNIEMIKNLEGKVIFDIYRGCPLICSDSHQLDESFDVFQPETNHFQDVEKNLFIVEILKGPVGFGFTVGNSPAGQIIKQIFDNDRCKDLSEGDILIAVGEINVKALPHSEVVTILKQQPKENFTTFVIERPMTYENANNNSIPYEDAAPDFNRNRDNSEETKSKTFNPSIIPSPTRSDSEMPFTESDANRIFSKNDTEECKKGEGPDMEEEETILQLSREQTYGRKRCAEITAFLKRTENGFGFRISGGSEEGSQVSIGQIVPNGAADLDQKLQRGDLIVSVDGINVINASHRRVVELMTIASKAGRVALGVRRQLLQLPNNNYHPYDVTLIKGNNEKNFGFIISSMEGPEPTIGYIMKGSAADKVKDLQVNDRILAINGTRISSMSHDQTIQLIRESGQIVTLTILKPFGKLPPAI
ncbi:DgyrCDS6582 [Dimorphilus gyrociliatus]|uniref:DgyrCDS6582 n=1 Tax=Dimorphilus gyrociliatus TaxID=2664684 RepID=A0A7I8VP48_9ANNE|nr:DgyrCDS6582 [Dimorphilus gyrociliatus]